jgi:hypothetical protein
MRRARNTLRSDKTANDKTKEIIEEGEAERDLQPTRDMEKANSCTPAVRRSPPSASNGVAAAKELPLVRGLQCFSAASLQQHNTNSVPAQRCLGFDSFEHKMLLFCMVLTLWNILHKCPFPNGDWDSSSKSSEKMYQFCKLKLVNHFGDWTFVEHVPQLGPPSSDLLPQMSRVSCWLVPIFRLPSMMMS